VDELVGCWLLERSFCPSTSMTLTLTLTLTTSMIEIITRVTTAAMCTAWCLEGMHVVLLLLLYDDENTE